MRPVHVAKFPFLTVLIEVGFTRLKHVACKNVSILTCVFCS